MNAIVRCSYAVLAVVGLWMAESGARAANVATQSTAAQLVVEDHAQLFSPEKISDAKSTLAQSMGTGPRQVHVETYPAMNEKDRKAYQDSADKSKFQRDWAVEKAKAEGDRGISIFVCTDPTILEVLVDRQMHDSGFTEIKRKELKDLLLGHLKSAHAKKGDEARNEFNAALTSAADYLRVQLPASTLTHGGGKHQDVKHDQNKEEEKKGGSSIMSYVCIGLAILLGLWLVMGLIRAFTGGHGGGGGMGGGGMGGGGGGGFMSSMLGGLFGAAAGMWLYNSFMGDHSSSAFGGDQTSGGDYGGGEAGGAGDYGGDQGSGGDYGSGGGDTGGGGGDWGGGGDTGGGGGDWGGGGGDSGGGGGGDW